MSDRARSKQKMLAGAIAAVLALGGAGYYYAVQPVKTMVVNHSDHQAAAPVTASGDVVTLDARARQLAGVQTAQAAARVLTKELKATGKIDFNASGQTYITSRIEGRVDELYVTADGAYIAPGQAIAAVYSPTYIAAQEEYLLTLENVRRLRDAGEDVVQINNRLRDAARRKLQLLNASEQDITRLEHTRQAQDHMTIYAQFGGTVLEKQVLPGTYIMPGDKLYSLSDLSSVWLYADIYEKDLAGITPGQPVAVTSSAYPGETFSGRVTLIHPVLDDATRTVKVRVELANPAGKLKPNMLVQAAVRIPLGEKLVVPESSLLDTGSRKIVFVAQNDRTFVKRDIVTGQAAEGYIQVLSGLQAGETVVTAAAFLLDSQTQLGSFGSHAGHGAAGGQTTPAPDAGQHSGHSGH
ncbi:efflux RND transporter periplasmic adaptor subunit|uniref:Membrane fusion protein, Cu(I)/Ag(I) efflux system n=1 Tax=Dendrosporobacter quercicolus TaxID=146817 RepID=A0A1G9XDD3_9FIRM|nr:efflux RND transporter periplasmic adaptor subunit [Dendrosporobacter quercicolus]NSL49695.1 efflux RND transporter periplasmic adaptor subunit [Dendrosporobacter quercicolus DSM 1736]SDM94809.1 membrane fusion protein, Cu(I)/Ag(I) efflux system [Dendrosporobacter quercicolus]